MTDVALEDVGGPAASRRPRQDVIIRRLLQIPDEAPVAAPTGAKTKAEGTFTASLLVSAVRCLLTYLILPFVGPAVGLAAGVGPWIGLPLSVVAIAANVMSIRRFWIADHRWRRPYTVVALGIIVLLAILAVGDILQLAR